MTLMQPKRNLVERPNCNTVGIELMKFEYWNALCAKFDAMSTENECVAVN